MTDQMGHNPSLSAGSSARWTAQTTPAGYAAPAGIADEKVLQDLAQLAQEILQDPLKMQHLSDAIFNCLRQDMASQWERDRAYGRRF